jgi:hypothetical protein
VATFDRALAAFRGRDVTCPLASSYGTHLPNQISGEDEVTFASVSPGWRLPGQGLVYGCGIRYTCLQFPKRRIAKEDHGRSQIG